jgi:carboxyl-terminal processing protease
MKENNRRGLSFFSKLAVIICIFNFICINSINAVDIEVPVKEARYLIENYYIEEVPEDILNLSSIEDIVDKLDDPYSKYFTKNEYNEFINSIDMKIYGIGIYVKMLEEGVLADSVIKGSPAEKAGIHGGDIIIEAEGVSLKGMESDEAISHIKGEGGTYVKLKVKRGEQLLSFEVVRKEIKLPTVEGAVIDEHIGYIALHSFGLNTENEFASQLEEMESRNVDSYIVDLRFNGGGYMFTAQRIAGYFIGGNTALVVRDKSGEDIELRAYKQDIIIDKPVIFLINGYSASASEILSAAVKDYDKAYFIGTNTFGKGVAQMIFNLTDGSAIKLTNEEFFSPLGKKINKVGISPQLEVKDVDAGVVARILLQTPKKGKDKSGYIRIKDGKWSFEINIEEGRKQDNWKVYKAILESISSDSKIYTGNKNGWNEVDRSLLGDKNNIMELMYSKYTKFKSFEKIPLDKKFSLTFSSEIDMNTVTDENIQLINVSTGERCGINFWKNDTNTVRVIPKEKLKEEDEYFLVINKGVKNKKGKSLNEEVIITVKTLNE